MPRTDRVDVAADALGPSSSRFIASSEPYRQAIRSPPRRSEPQLGSGPTRAETRASRWKRSRKEARNDLPTSSCGVATARPHGFSRSSIAPGPAVRANPSDELQNYTRREAGSSVTQRPQRCCHRHSRRAAPAEPKIHRSNATSHEKSQRFASRDSETPYHQTVAETLPSYLARSTRRPKPLDRSGPAPQRPPMLPPERTRLYASTEARQDHDGTAFTETVALRPLRSMLHDRGRGERAARTTGRLPGHRRVRSTPAEAIADVAHQLPDGCPVKRKRQALTGRSQQKTLHRRSVPDGCPVSVSAEPSPAEASKNPAPTNPGRVPGQRQTLGPPRPKPRKTSPPANPGRVPGRRQTLGPPRPKPRKTSPPANPGRGARSTANARSPAAEAEKDVTPDEAQTGCLVVATLHPPRPKPRRMSHSSFRTGARSAPRSNLSGQSRRGRHTTSSGRCPVGAALRPPRPKPKKTSHNEFRTVPGRRRAPPSAAEAKEDVTQRVPDVSPIPLLQLAVAANGHPTRRRYRTASRSRTRSRSPEYARARPPDTSACRAATRDRSGGSASHPAHLEIHFHHAAMRTPESRAAMVSPPRRELLYSDSSSGKSRDRSDRHTTVARAEAPGRAAAIRSGRGGG